ncbi:probable serine/threonine-protein kinase MARK-A [Eurosta solidaginis]|uniref:probable serine/threonine-protein kinase MARK-A n=1 Tax=Eurosta solidaginis TaxID=178769 RepID=UPI00353114D9
MTTTISKHELQLQQQCQQQQRRQLLLLQQQQQHVQYTDQQLQQQEPQQLQQQQPRTSILFKPTTNKSLLFNNTVSSLVDNTQNIYDLDAASIAAISATQANTTTTTRLDSATTIIQIDSINNNNTTTTLSTTTTAITTATTPTNNNGTVLLTNDMPESEPKTQKRRSLLNFKSFDFHIKSLYSGLRNGNKHSQSQSSSLGGGDGGVGGGGGCIEDSGSGRVGDSNITDNANGSGLLFNTPTAQRGEGQTMANRIPPYLKIETVDPEEAENLLLDYPQSSYSSRRNSSHEDENRSSSQLLHINRYDMCSRSQASSSSPYYLSPYPIDVNMRRSSTSDIMSGKRSGTSSTSDSRRPSTSDLLRKARERRGSEARMGRSVSHSGLPRGGPRLGGAGGGGGGRRTSMAF